MACQPKTKPNSAARRAPASTCSATSACPTTVSVLSRCMPLCKRQRQRRRRGSRTSSSAFSTATAIKNAARRPLAPITARKYDLNSALVQSSTKKIRTRLPGMKARPAPLLGVSKSLPRPALKEVSQEALTAADPSLANIPPFYVRKHLNEVAPSMLMGMSDVIPMKGSQTQIDVLLPNPNAIAPSHMLVVSSSSETPQRIMAPIHSIVLAAHCSNLPPMSASSSTRPSADPQVPITLPIQHIRVPSAPTFPILSGYLYHKRTEILLGQLLPIAPPAGCELNEQAVEFGQRLARECGTERVAESLLKVKGVWQNAYALGVVDETIFNTLDLACAILSVAQREIGSPASC